MDPRLAAVAEDLERTGWAAELCDAQWRLVWVSPELKLILGNDDPADYWLGRHTVAARLSPAFRSALTDGSAVSWFRDNIPRIASTTEGGIEAVLAELPAERVEELGPLEPVAAHGMWTGENVYVQRGLPPARTRYMVIPLHTADGERLGWAQIFGGGIPASLLSLVARGSRSMFRRMADLLEPGSHETAVIFADIQASSDVARHVSTPHFFELIRSFATGADDVVIRNNGIVGRHAGDGLVAFFLAEQAGGRAGACAAALHCARSLVRWQPENVDVGELHVNVGVHWGGALYLGQVVTGGRLEVTALGDEVNECARIQQSARNGTLLVSKAVIERLDPADAAELGIDPVAARYRTVGEIPGVTDKAVRDAGGIPVVALAPH